MLWDSSKVMATREVVDAVAVTVVPGMVDLGSTAEVVMEEGPDPGLLASGAVSWSTSSSSPSLLDSLMGASNTSHSLGTEASTMAAVKFA